MYFSFPIAHSACPYIWSVPVFPPCIVRYSHTRANASGYTFKAVPFRVSLRLVGCMEIWGDKDKTNLYSLYAAPVLQARCDSPQHSTDMCCGIRHRGLLICTWVFSTGLYPRESSRGLWFNLSLLSCFSVRHTHAALCLPELVRNKAVDSRCMIYRKRTGNKVCLPVPSSHFLKL